jgi:succinoglycan biosynthesis transport protein ExoP
MNDDTRFDRDPRGISGAPGAGTRGALHPDSARSGVHSNGSREEGIVRADFADPRYAYDMVGYAPGMRDQMAMPTRWVEEESEDVDVRQILTMLRRRWKILLTTFVAVVTLGVIYTWTVRPVYQATTKILVDSQKSSSELPIFSDLLGASQARSVDTQIEILKSIPVQKGARQRLASAPQVPADVKAAIDEYAEPQVLAVGDTDVVDVSIYTYNPRASAALSRAVAEEYIRESRDKNQGQVRTASQYVGHELQEVQQRLNRARTALANYKANNATFDLPTESKGMIAEVATAEANWRQAEADRTAANAQLRTLESLAARMPQTEITPGNLTQPQELTSTRAQLAQLEIKRAELLQEYTPGSPEVQQVEGQIASLRQDLSRMSRLEVSTLNQRPNPIKESLNQQIAALRGQVQASDKRVGALAVTARRLRGELGRLPQQEKQLGQLETDLAAQLKTYEMLNEKYQSLRISEEAQVASAQILSLANVPNNPVSPRKALNIAMSVVLGLMLAVALAALADRLDDRVHSTEEAELISQLPVLAQVPLMKGKDQQDQKALLEGNSKHSMLLESFRMLRTNIAFSALDEPIRSVVVTSGQPHEGKSVSAVNLAIAMAMSGKRVILIDADLRRPALHRIFGLSNETGFTSVVAGLSPLEEAFQETKIPGLRVLTSGPPPINPPELLSSQAGRACLQQTMEQADFVVLDSPPALVMADAHILSTVADGVLLVVSSKEAGKREIIQTRRLLAQTGAKMLGIVLNKVTPDVDGLYGYYGYYADYMDAPDHNGSHGKDLAVTGHVTHASTNGHSKSKEG